MAAKHLSTQFLNEITNRLVSALEPEQIFLFGSYAYGEPTEDSDIDLLVIISKSDEPRYRRARQAYKALRGIGIPKDILVMTRSEVELKASVANSLVNQVIRQGKLLYG
jgi:predicted nucleotidyltransferase